MAGEQRRSLFCRGAGQLTAVIQLILLLLIKGGFVARATAIITGRFCPIWELLKLGSLLPSQLLLILTATAKPMSASSVQVMAVGGIPAHSVTVSAFIVSAPRPTLSRPAISPATAKPTSPFSVLPRVSGLFKEVKTVRSSAFLSAP